MELGTRIKAVADLYKTRVKAAAAAGISTDQLQSYVTGQSKPALIPIGNLASGVGVSLDWIWSGQPPMRRESGGQSQSDGTVDGLGFRDAVRETREERARYQGEGAVPFESLEMCITTLEQWLMDRKQQMTPAEKARALIAIYQYAKLKQVLDGGELAEIIQRIKG